MSTLTFKNFQGNLTRISKTSVDSTNIEDGGKAMFGSSFGYDSLGYPGVINFVNGLTDISGGVITDAIIDGQERVENGVPYIYAIGHTGRFYKIQVTAPAFHAPQYDVATLITTLTTATSFTMGGSLMFYGSPERVYIGHDDGVTAINTDGSGEELIGDANQWVSDVPRQAIIFFDILYYSNGSSVAAINPDSSVNYMAIDLKTSSEFIVKDLNLDVDGQNLIIVSSNIPNTSLLSSGPNLNATYSALSQIYTYSGTGKQVTNIVTIPSFDQTALETFGKFSYSFGYDIAGSVMASLTGGFDKIVSGLFIQSPVPNASSSNGNFLGWTTPEYSFSRGALVGSLFLYGNLDAEFDTQFIRQIQFPSSLASGDVLRVPWTRLVSNFQFGGGTSSYTGNAIGLGRMYISTIEYNGVTYAYKLYSFYNVSPGANATTGVYETQAVLKDTGMYTPTAYAAYLNPVLATGTSFKLELIGVDGNPLTSSSTTFTPATGATLASGTISVSPAAALGVRVTNIGPNSAFINKVEVTV